MALHFDACPDAPIRACPGVHVSIGGLRVPCHVVLEPLLVICAVCVAASVLIKGLQWWRRRHTHA